MFRQSFLPLIKTHFLTSTYDAGSYLLVSTLSRNMYISICIFILRVCIHVYIFYYYVFIDIVKRTRIYNIHIVRNTYVALWKDAYSTYATATQFRFEKRLIDVSSGLRSRHGVLSA